MILALLRFIRFVFKNSHPRHVIRNFIRALAWQVRKRTTKKPLRIVFDNKALFDAYPDCVISSSIIYSDMPDLLEISLLRKLNGISSTFLDIGANVGLYSLAMIGYFKSIYAFEPTPLTFSRLRHNSQINGEAFQCINIGLGETNKKAFLRAGKSVCSTNKIVSSGGNDTLEITVKPLDYLDDAISSCVVKMDVEGYEKNIILGARKLLSAKKILCLQMENLAGTSAFGEIATLLEMSGYILFAYKGKGAFEMELSRLRKIANIFSCPQSCFENIKKIVS